VFGEVTAGMENIDKLKKGEGQGGQVSNPDKIVSMKLASDVD
jgi:peptidyl-prolyl cis-trans isomerase A (cyclophilin A)